MNNTYDSKYSIAIEINLKLGNEPKNFDGTYSICMDIYNKLGGDKTSFDSIYSILESIMQLIDAEHTNKFDSIYSQCLSIYNKLGGEPKLFDSTYSILLGILPLVEPEPADAKYVKVDDLNTLQDGDEFVICTFSTSDWSISDTSIGYVITDYATNTGRYNGSPTISIENNNTIYQQLIDDISTTFNGEVATPLKCKIKSIVSPNAGFLIIVNDTKCMYTAKSSNGLRLMNYVDGATEITNEMIFDVSTRNSNTHGTDLFFWCPYVTSTTSTNYRNLTANEGGTPRRYWISMYSNVIILNDTFRVFKKITS